MMRTDADGRVHAPVGELVVGAVAVDIHLHIPQQARQVVPLVEELLLVSPVHDRLLCPLVITPTRTSRGGASVHGRRPRFLPLLLVLVPTDACRSECGPTILKPELKLQPTRPCIVACARTIDVLLPLVLVVLPFLLVLAGRWEVAGVLLRGHLFERHLAHRLLGRLRKGID